MKLTINYKGDACEYKSEYRKVIGMSIDFEKCQIKIEDKEGIKYFNNLLSVFITETKK